MIAVVMLFHCSQSATRENIRLDRDAAVLVVTPLLIAERRLAL